MGSLKSSEKVELVEMPVPTLDCGAGSTLIQHSGRLIWSMVRCHGVRNSPFAVGWTSAGLATFVTRRSLTFETTPADGVAPFSNTSARRPLMSTTSPMRGCTAQAVVAKVSVAVTLAPTCWVGVTVTFWAENSCGGVVSWRKPLKASCVTVVRPPERNARTTSSEDENGSVLPLPLKDSVEPPLLRST